MFSRRNRSRNRRGRIGPPDRRVYLSSFAVLLALLLAASGLSAFATPPGEAAEAPTSETVPPRAPTPAEMEAAQANQVEHRTPAELKASRTEFAELPAGEARELLTEEFPQELEGLEADPARVLTGADVEKSLGEYAARVSIGNGESAIIESSAPVESEVGSGEEAPVDLTLEREGDHYVPSNPLTATELPAAATDPIELGQGVSLELPAEAESEARPLGTMNLFYPETGQSTDSMVAPTAAGVEVYEQLRSAESPEEFRYPVTLSGQAELRTNSKGGAEVVSAQGNPIGEFLPATAVDAAGREVPVTTTVEGSELVVEVDHSSADIAYPILLDPHYIEDGWGGFDGWWYPNNWTGRYGLYNEGSALHAVSVGGWPYSAAEWAQFEYTPSNATAYAEAATFSNIYYFGNGCSTATPYGYVGIWNIFSGSYDSLGLWNGGGSYSPNFQTGWVGRAGTRKVLVGIGGEANISCPHEIFVGGVTVQQNDPENPVFEAVSGVPAGWFPTPTAVSATAYDPGFGVQYIRMSDGGSTIEGYFSCNGTRGARCGDHGTWNPVPPYQPGVRTLSLNTEDPTGKVGYWSTTSRYDPYAPEITATGTLGSTNFPLTVNSKDGTAGTPTLEQSGIKEVKVYLDGTLKETRTNSCNATTGCPSTLNFTYNQAIKGLAAGKHTLEAIAFDQVGHQHAATATFTLEVPNTTITSGPEGLTKETTPKFTYTSTVTGSTFQCRVDAGAWVSCAATGYTTAKLAEGPHSFEVKATSGAGLEDPTPAKREFTVLGPPDTTIVFGPKGSTGAKRPTFGYESNNSAAWFECKLDSGSYEPCGPATYETLEGHPGEVLTEGAHSVSVRAVNQLEVADPTPAVASFTVDGAAPKAEITSGPEGPTAEARPTFNFTASGGTVACFLETEGEAETEEAEPPFAACTTSSSYTPPSNLAEGSYVLHLRAQDAAMNETEDQRAFSVDMTAPETTITSAPPTITDNATPTIEFSSSEAESSFQCRYDSEAFRACSGPGATDTPATALPDGAHTFQVRAIDLAGNADATPATAAFTLVTNGPQTAINSGPEGAIGATEATFTYSTDETATKECRLDGASFASCPTASKTYTGLTEGEHVFEVRGKNTPGVVDPTPARRAFVVDTSAPSTPVLSGPVFEAGGYGLHFQVEASDGSPSTAASRRSGVESVQILLAGEVVMELGAECSAKICPASFVRQAQIPWGPLLAAPAGAVVQAKAKDALGHTSTASLEIKEPHEHAVQPTGSGSGAFALAAGGAKAAAATCSKHTHVEVRGTTMYGTCGNDKLVAPAKVTLVEGLDGNDVIIGGKNTNLIKGGEGADIIRGGGGNGKLKGEGGADHIYGGNGDDELLGEEGVDVLDGGPGEDVEKGGSGNDTLRGGQGPDFLYGGPDTDTVSFADALAPGFAEAESEQGTAGRPNLYKPAKEKALGAGIKSFPPPTEAGVYIRFANGSTNVVEASNGDPAEGGGTDTLRKSEDERIVGSPFADWIEGEVAKETIEPGPGEDMIFNAGSKLTEKDPADWVDGSRGAYTAPSGPVAGMYQAGAEKNVYVVGTNAGESLTAKLTGNQVRITGSVTKTLTVGEALGALVLYGGGNHDVIKVTNENKERPGAVELDGGPGPDELVGGPMEELLVDGIQQGSGAERLNGAGGEDDLAQGEGADKVEGGAGDDLFLNSRICEGDSFYAFSQGFEAGKHKEEAEEAEDNAQFHLLPDVGVYANMQKEELGGQGNNLEAVYKLNCGGKAAEPLKNFNAFEGSPQNDLVRGNANHNYILGRGGENKLYGGGGPDTILANNAHPELVVDCGGQNGDTVKADPTWDVHYNPPAKKMEATCEVHKEKGRYNDNQEAGTVNKERKLHPVGGGGGKAAVAPAGEPGGFKAESLAESLVTGAYPTTEFRLDETTGTSAANALDEEAPGTYMAKGTGPSVGGPGPVLGGEGALLEGGEEPEEEGSSISLDGSTAYVDLNGQGGPVGDEAGYSVSLYVKFAAAPGKREYLFSSAGTGGRGAFLYRAPNGSIVFTTGQLFGPPAVASEPVDDGNWHQVVASLEGQTISLNVDGFPYELGYGSNVTPALESSPESLLGAGPGAIDLLDGSLDQFTSYEGVPAEGDIFPMLAGSRALIAEYLPVAAPEGDEDGDGVPDGLDNCPATPNPDQADGNLDGIGDACQSADQDEDGIVDASDNCPTIYNPEQTDTNGDGVGDACSNISPEVETGGSKEVKATTATIEGTVDPEGSATSYYFEYGPTTSYGTKIPATPKSIGAGFATVKVSQALTGLAQATTYHYRLVAENAAGTETGLDQTFLTLKAPKATTGSATAIGTTTATVNGTVNPEGLATSYYFEYGPTISYGTKIPVTPKEVGAGTSEVAVSQALSGLTSGATYHYRLAATSVAATTNGADKTFATEASSPVPAELGAMVVTDPFNATTTPVSNFATNWSALGWASGTPAKGEDRTTGWGASAAWPTINGAYYAPVVTDVGTGVADVATVASGPGNNFPSRYFSLWLDLQTPGSTRSGYQVRFVQTTLNVYEVILAKWSAGTESVLATKTGYSLAAGSSVALVDEGSKVAVWTNTGAAFTQLLTAADSAFSGGNGGVEASGNESRLTKFKIGQLLPAATNMSGALGALRLDDAFATTESPLSEGGTWAALSWDYASAYRTGHVVAAEGWGPSDPWESGEAINGAYWTKATFADTGAGDAVAATLKVRPGLAARHFELLLNMPTPATARSGYELRFTEPTANTGVYTVTLVKWASGTATTLATQANVSLAIGGRFGLADKAGVLSVWTAAATGEFTQLLSASDATYQSGYLGIAGGGNFARLANFRGAQLPPF
jgi:Ca2+-binding RTX toxin-like protein